MKIVILCAYFQPELGYREYYYPRNLAKLGHDVSVVTSDRIIPFPNWEDIAKAAGHNISRFRDSGTSKLNGFTLYRLPVLFEYERLLFLRGVTKLLSAIRPDVVHIIENGMGYSIPVALRKRSLGYKLVYEIEISFSPGHMLRKREYAEYFLVKKPLLRYMIGKADKLNICSDQVREFLQDQIRSSRNKIRSTVLGADPDLFYINHEERSETRNAMGVTEDEILIISASKIEPQKLYDMLIKYFGILKHEFPKVRLLIVGSGDADHMKFLKRAAEIEGIRDSLLFYPFVKKTELRKFYNAADIGVWTQATITMLEAVACGLPIIVPNDKATRHLVEDGNGQAYGYRNWTQLVDCLKYYMNTENRIEACKKAIMTFESKYSYLTLARQLVDDVYMPVLSESEG